jgi:hypothetical protein
MRGRPDDSGVAGPSTAQEPRLREVQTKHQFGGGVLSFVAIDRILLILFSALFLSPLTCISTGDPNSNLLDWRQCGRIQPPDAHSYPCCGG